MLRVLVIYATRLGSTADIARHLAQRLENSAIEADAVGVDDPDLAIALPDRDGYVIGSAIYAGHWLAPAVELVRRCQTSLASRPVWLFSSGPVGETAVSHEPADPKEMARMWAAVRPRDHRVFAGALDRGTLADADLGRVERFVAERFVPEGDYRDWPAIDAWADDIARALGAPRSSTPSGRSTVG